MLKTQKNYRETKCASTTVFLWPVARRTDHAPTGQCRNQGTSSNRFLAMDVNTCIQKPDQTHHVNPLQLTYVFAPTLGMTAAGVFMQFIKFIMAYTWHPKAYGTDLNNIYVFKLKDDITFTSNSFMPLKVHPQRQSNVDGDASIHVTFFNMFVTR